MQGNVLAVMTDPTAVGTVVGAVFWTAVAILGIIKCFSIARRETTSAICVHSLTLTLCIHVLMQMAALGRDFLEDPLQLIMTILVVVAACILAIIGITLAIIGLATYHRSYASDGTRRAYVQGRKQAGWAIALNSIFGLFFIGAVVVGIVGRVQATTQQHQAVEKRQTEYVFTNENFQVTLPNKKWVQLDAKTINPDAILVLMRRNPELYLAVIAEQPGVEAGVTVESLIEVTHATMKAAAPTAVFSEVEPRSINGFDGFRYSVDARVGSLDASYSFWCGSTNGYCYQVMLWTERRNKAAMFEHADALIQGFSQVDPSHRTYTSGAGAFGDRRSDSFGYSIDLRDTDWLAWEGVREEDEIADTGGVHPSGARFSVSPMSIPHADPPLDLVHRAYLELYDYMEPIKDDQSSAITSHGMQGIAYSFSNGENYCVEQVLLSSNCAYLVSVWRPVTAAEGLEAVAQQVFNAVTFETPAIEFQSLEKLPADRRAAQGRMINRVGLGYYHAGRFAESIDWFTAGHSCDATNATYFGNILAAHSQINQYEEGLALLDSAAEELRKSEDVRSWEATMLAGEGRVAEADGVYTSLFEGDYSDDDDFMAWTQLRADNGLWDGLDTIFDNYMGSNPDIALRTHQFDLLYAKGDYEQVADLARRFLKEQGFSPDIAYWLIDVCQELGLYNEALKVSETLIEKGYATVDAYQEKAYCQYRLNWYRQSKETLETALKLNPRNETTKEWIGIVSAELGEGDNSCLKEFIEPVALPEELASGLAGNPAPGFGSNFGAYYDRHLVLWNYKKGEELKQTDVRHIKLLDDAGVAAFSSFEFGFDPVAQNIFVNELLVRNDAGDVVARGAVKDYYVMDDHSDGMVSEDKKLVIPVPSLQPGYSIELAITRSFSSPPGAFYFKQHFLAAGFPVLNCAVYLGGDIEDVAFRKLNGIEEIRSEGGILWKGREPYAYKREPMQIPEERFVPSIALGTPEESWKNCGETYLEDIGGKLGGSVELKQRADKLTEGCKTDEEKFKVIADWVRSAFTYKPIEFGRSAYIPDTATDTLSYHYGDCKDLSVLLKVLLESVDIECRLVLVNSTDDIFPEIETTDQFNHMITYIPQIRGGLFVDPTDQEADAFLPVPQGLQNRKALVLEADTSALVSIPSYKTDSSSCSINREVSIAYGKPVRIKDHVLLRGYYASWMRAVLKDRQKVKWAEWFQHNLADYFQGLEVKSVSARNVSDSAKDLELEITCQLGGETLVDGDESTELNIPPIWVRYYLFCQNVQNRKNPFHRTFPLDIDVSVKVGLTDGYRKLSPPFGDDAGSNRFLHWKADGADRFSCRLKPGDFSANEYADYVETMNRGIKAARAEIKVIKESPAKKLAEKSSD